MTLEIRKLGDLLLRERSREVEEIDQEIKGLIEAMGETIQRVPGRVGLAAPQVGVLKRLFAYDLGHGVRGIINPSIIDSEGEKVCEEGCLSVPGVFVSLPRYDRVMMRCTTSSGHNIVIEAQGFMAQVFQHECDHLDGVLIIDRCDEEERRRALEEYQNLELQREQRSA
ncbi:MAG: peptide deformylase [Actinobacteria bacterium]|nr:peptide deformylase [Actinomycetota bacterium]